MTTETRNNEKKKMDEGTLLGIIAASAVGFTLLMTIVTFLFIRLNKKKKAFKLLVFSYFLGKDL